MTQPFDPKAMRLTGDPQPVVEQIGTGGSVAHFSVTPGGVMASRTGPGNRNQLTWLDRRGSVLEKIGEPGELQGFSLSPDQTRMALFRNGDVWLLDVKRNVQTPLTVDHGASTNDWPVWSPDGKQVAYSSTTGLYVRGADGAGDPKRLREGGRSVHPTDWSHDGKFLIYTDNTGAGAGDVLAIPVQDGAESKGILTTPAREAEARLSPDGRWIAHISNRSGRTEVYVQPFAAPSSGAGQPGAVTQISRDGGTYPRWRSDGKELFFRNPGGAVMAVEIGVSGDTLLPTAPIQLFPSTGRTASWEVSKDGQRFLLEEPLDRGIATPITVVMNWEAALKK
jgi:Tol biopolymer transport system component